MSDLELLLYETAALLEIVSNECPKYNDVLQLKAEVLRAAARELAEIQPEPRRGRVT